jgi:nucleotidyltransferase substrate binding protein (TIGR01987 family)
MYKIERLQGREVANSPRDSIRVAAQINLIDDPATWLDYVEHRNRTTHTYNEEVADEVYEAVRDFPPLTRKLIKSSERILTQTITK